MSSSPDYARSWNPKTNTQSIAVAKRYAELCVRFYGAKTPTDEQIREWAPVFSGMTEKEVERAIYRIGLDANRKNHYRPNAFEVATNVREHQDRPGPSGHRRRERYEVLPESEQVKLRERCATCCEVIVLAKEKHWSRTRLTQELVVAMGGTPQNTIQTGASLSKSTVPLSTPLLDWLLNVGVPQMCSACGYRPGPRKEEQSHEQL